MLNLKNHLPMIVIRIFTPGFVFTGDGTDSFKLVPLSSFVGTAFPPAFEEKLCQEMSIHFQEEVLVGKWC